MSARRRLAAVAFVLFFSGLCLAEGQRLRYRTHAQPHALIGGTSRVRLTIRDTAPEGLPCPEFKHQAPLFLEWSTPAGPNGKVSMALDGAAAQGAYTHLYVDSDLDGALDDEKPIANSRSYGSGRQFGPLRLRIPADEGPRTYHVNLEYRRSVSGHYAFLSTGGWYEGEVTVGGVKRLCQLIDYNCDALFQAENGATLADHDRLRIADAAGRSFREFLPGGYVKLGGVTYRPAIGHDGASLFFAAAEDVATGTLRVPEDVTHLDVWGEKGLFDETPEKGVVEVPAGAYRLRDYQITRKDDAGATWTLRGHNYRGGDTFEVAAGKETALKIGGPLTARLSYARRRGRLSFSQSLAGPYQESLTLMKGRARAPAPRLEIVSADGQWRHTFQFRYG
jgi:hypothetical protein